MFFLCHAVKHFDKALYNLPPAVGGAHNRMSSSVFGSFLPKWHFGVLVDFSPKGLHLQLSYQSTRYFLTQLLNDGTRRISCPTKPYSNCESRNNGKNKWDFYFRNQDHSNTACPIWQLYILQHVQYGLSNLSQRL